MKIGIGAALAVATVAALQGGALAVADEATESGKKSARLTVTLKDGSRVIGSTAATAFRIKTSFATLSVPLNAVSDLTIDVAHEQTRVVMNNADRISGVLEEVGFELVTVFGRVSIPAEAVVKIAVENAEAGRDWNVRKQALYYSFDSGGDVKIKDDSGNGNDGENHDGVLVDGGKRRGGLKLNGTTAYVNIPGPAVKDFPAWENYTISVWFLNDGKGDQSDGRGQKIIDKTVMYHDFHLCVIPSGALRFVTVIPGGDGFLWGELNDDTYDYRDGKWHHAVVVKKGTHGELWVDGARKASCETLQQVKNDGPLLLGYSQSSDSPQRKHWSGMIDELRIFRDALTESDIKTLGR